MSTSDRDIMAIHTDSAPSPGGHSNLLAVVRAAECEVHDLLKITVYIVGIEHWGHFNELYAHALGEVRPARSVVPVPALHHGYVVEIDAIAARRR